jgi:hypothetical protein
VIPYGRRLPAGINVSKYEDRATIYIIYGDE